MLVLTRKIGERIIIGSDVEITVLRIRGRQVRLGLTAPPQLCIRRIQAPKAKEPTAVAPSAVIELSGQE